MKSSHLTLFLLLTVGLPLQLQGQAKPKDTMILKGAPIGGVKFEHKLHSTRVADKCETCHHPSKPEKPAKAAQQACRDCHTKPVQAGMKTGTQAAFHNATATAGNCCINRDYLDDGIFANRFGEVGCLLEIGCKGPFAHGDCPVRQWNSGVSWCVSANAPCMGCTEPGFPDEHSPLYQRR